MRRLALMLCLACSSCIAMPMGVHSEVASWYGNENGQTTTATGEHYNPEGMTAAHRTLPFGTRVQVCHDSACVIVRINDRGPFVAGRDIDLSHGAAKAIGCLSVCQVTIEPLYTPRHGDFGAF